MENQCLHSNILVESGQAYCKDCHKNVSYKFSQLKVDKEKQREDKFWNRYQLNQGSAPTLEDFINSEGTLDD